MNYRYFILITALLFNSYAIAEEDKFSQVRSNLRGCFVCHGHNGASQQPALPIIAGQEFDYLYATLSDMKNGLHGNPIMSPIAEILEDVEMQLIAEFFSQQKWPEIDNNADIKQQEAGKLVAESGQCFVCHRTDLLGDGRVPRIANQHSVYLRKAMFEFKHSIRQNSPTMSALLSKYNVRELQNVAHYLSNFSEEQNSKESKTKSTLALEN